MVTRIADVVVPEVFSPYTVNMSTELSELIASGIAVRDGLFDGFAAGGGATAQMPYWNPIAGSSEGLSDTDALTVDGLSAAKDVAVIHRRGKAWGTNDMAVALAGDDPAGMLAASVAAFWRRDYQKTLVIPSLQGIFATALASTHVNDVSIAAGDASTSANWISRDAMIDTMQKRGDHWDDIQAIAMHSAVFGRLQKDDEITFRPASQQGLRIPQYLERDVLVDDGMPRVAGATSGWVYSSYLFGAGAVALGEGGPAPDIMTELARDALAGTDVLVTRRHVVVHPRGVAWTGTAAGDTPTAAELATGTNWAKRWDDKLIKLVELKTNG